MMHSPILPILIPFVASILLLLMSGRSISVQRSISAVAAILLIAASAHLLLLTDTLPPLTYALGEWAPPFGIVLVADRLAALGVMVTSILAAAALLYASSGFDTKGRHFHTIFQLQLVGINGAFLTGDMFNLFVFFEVMLLASYILLAHGGGINKSRAGFAYVTLNLAGSAVFLIALGMIYGTLGTLNLADIALQLQSVPPEQASLVRLAGALLVTVFLLKAAVLPLSFWLPHAYAAAGAPVAALFAIMTKVGIIATLRVQMVAFDPAATTQDIIGDWLVIAALATIVFAALGILTAKRLQASVAWLVLGSAGVLLIVPPLATSIVTAAGLYYLVQSAIVGAAFFMLAGLISAARGTAEDTLIGAGRLSNNTLKLGFLVLAATAAGLPPFSGFIGKLMLLYAVQESYLVAAIWAVMLIAGLITTVALAKAGSSLFWEIPSEGHEEMHQEATTKDLRQYIATFSLVALALSLVVFAQPVSDFAQRTAAQLHDPQQYIQAVIPDHGAINRVTRP
ncbi:MAG: monovalent cation/H+ antiporter subunit D [Methylophilaceae bacterium]|nr:monovalent cation/H+ antiporter subunit D [Methylophilaceae bacterium]